MQQWLGQLLIMNKEITMEYFKLKPYFSVRLWGSDRLASDYNYDLRGATNIGEAWVLSGMPHQASIIDNPQHTWHNKPFDEFIRAHAKLFNIKNRLQLYPLLAKIITPQQNLSVQVHPADDYAWRHEHALGKPEGWFVLDCPQDAYIIYGHKMHTKTELAMAIKKGQWEKLLNKIPVIKNHFYYIPPGTIHALTADVVVYELQQSSDVTYRLYDYDRVDPITQQKRDLHYEDSVANIVVPNEHAIKATPDRFGDELLDFSTPFFDLVVLETKTSLHFMWKKERVGHITCLQGSVILNEHIKMHQGETIFLYNITNLNMKLEGVGQIIVCWPPM